MRSHHLCDCRLHSQPDTRPAVIAYMAITMHGQPSTRPMTITRVVAMTRNQYDARCAAYAVIVMCDHRYA
ncbi:hypothetical protein GW17_00026863 [Ensete ventricosum]|nr:hypothetical protein GW17_00026863 [Ensete ventricosum]RZS09775.1 hypothetical protein BHM03_00040882 [Ensete ventricosum]